MFLDRDGTMIDDVGYIADPSAVRLLDGAADALRAFAELGFAVVVVSNQSGVGRGMFGLDTVWAVDAEMRRRFAAEGAHIDASYYCPHHPGDGCACRKPAPGMLLDAVEALDLDLARSWMIGDRESDLGAGRAAGCRVAAVGFRPADHDVPARASLAELVEVVRAAA